MPAVEDEPQRGVAVAQRSIHGAAPAGCRIRPRPAKGLIADTEHVAVRHASSASPHKCVVNKCLSRGIDPLTEYVATNSVGAGLKQAGTGSTRSERP